MLPTHRSRFFSVRAALRRRLAPRSYVAAQDTYDRMTEPPTALIGPDGAYPAGWYSAPPPELNLEANRRGGRRRLHRWFYIHFDSADFFVGANLIDLRFGGNVGIVLLDKRTGRFTVSAETGLLSRNAVEISQDGRTFVDRRTGSFIRISADDRVLEFHLDVQGTVLKGSATALFRRAFVQSTRLGPHAGTLQSWGNLTLDHAALESDGRTIELAAGQYGAYDRSVGHRRLIENWNWIATCGQATRQETGETLAFAFHAAADRSQARPRVDGRKSILWIGDAMIKLPRLTFEYGYTDRRRLDTTTWRIASARDAASWIDLTFEPRFHRRDARRIPLVFHVDHSQYFGEVAGELCVDGRRFAVEDVFATTEDSMMIA